MTSEDTTGGVRVARATHASPLPERIKERESGARQVEGVRHDCVAGVGGDAYWIHANLHDRGGV
jgi:hypothetical protein